MSKVQFQLQGDCALVTGGASGIGLAVSTILAKSGCKVAINDVNGEKLDTAVNVLRSAGGDVRGFCQDISSKERAQQLVRDAEQWLGGINYLVNNAGTPNTPKPIPASDLPSMDEPF